MVPTKETLKIPSCWLEDNLDIAFQLPRESYLYSEASVYAAHEHGSISRAIGFTLLGDNLATTPRLIYYQDMNWTSLGNPVLMIYSG